MPPVVSIVGKSKSGKTTVIERLIQELNSRGYRVATIKHAPQGTSFDEPGKNSWRHIEAGSEATVVSSPDNVVLVIAGKFDEAKALQFVQKHFGAIPRPERKLDATYTEEPAQDGERVVTLRRVGDASIVGVAYHVPAGPHPDFLYIPKYRSNFDQVPYLHGSFEG